MTDTLFASWLLPEVAAEHDDMNREYFEKGTVDNYPYFNKLRDAMAHITQAERGILSCLDVGCGAGWQAKYLDMVGFGPILKYDGLDISSHMCERAKKNYLDSLGFEVVNKYGWDAVSGLIARRK